MKLMLVAAILLSSSLFGQAINKSGWTDKQQRLEGGKEADLLVRTGDINNLGFGWPDGFDPFSGKSTPPHNFPWPAPKDEPAGTDRIMTGSALTAQDVATRGLGSCDGYSQRTDRRDTPVQPITLTIGKLPNPLNAILFQFFVDDFQPVPCGSRFQVSISGTRIPGFEEAFNALDQTGPIGKLISLRLLPEYHALLRSGTVSVLIDDPLSHRPDGYAVDFARVLVNPHRFAYEVTLKGRVLDAKTRQPIRGASVTAALGATQTDSAGRFALTGLPAGLVTATASQPGYDDAVKLVDVVAGDVGQAELILTRRQEDATKLVQEIAQTGTAALYGIHFDTDLAKIRPDSLPSLQAVLSVIQADPQAHWIIAGHTDNKGAADHNQALSRSRAEAVMTWLVTQGVNAAQLQTTGQGSEHPVADNTTENGRALNRRVELTRLPR